MDAGDTERERLADPAWRRWGPYLRPVGVLVTELLLTLTSQLMILLPHLIVWSSRSVWKC